MAPHSLVLGGVRSGKTGFAETLTLRRALRPAYIFSAPSVSRETAQRLTGDTPADRARFTCVAAPLLLRQSLVHHAGHHDVLLVDCISDWITNLLAHEGDVASEITLLCETLAQLRDTEVVLISNEIGMGPRPESPAMQLRVELVGAAHQRLAEVCENVYFVAAGLPLRFKGAAAPGLA